MVGSAHFYKLHLEQQKVKQFTVWALEANCTAQFRPGCCCLLSCLVSGVMAASLSDYQEDEDSWC